MTTDMSGGQIREGQVLTGPLFAEPMRVVTVRVLAAGSMQVGLVGADSGQFRAVHLDPGQLADVSVIGGGQSYGGDGESLRLGLEAWQLGIAHEYDPYFGLSLSRVDPLPHQLDAVYGHLLKLPTVRFLLADDAGAGKTIMAGLLIRELKLRGLAERILVVCPANLAFQWQREMRDKFDEQFFVLRGSGISEQYGVNQWLEHGQVITSMDLAKRADILPGLRQAAWDLVIVDEAHRMSAQDETHKSQRYRLGELLRDSTSHMLLLTATPHKGDPDNFTLFLQLLDPDAYADVRSIRAAMERGDAPFYLRRTKEAMVEFPSLQPDGTRSPRPIFTRRFTRTADFALDGEEFDLYGDVTMMVREQSERAAERGDDRRARAVGFLMALYQRRFASSVAAMRRSLERRAERLEEQTIDLAARSEPPDADDLEEMDDAEREDIERRLAAVTLAINAEEVRREADEMRVLAGRARVLEDADGEAKLATLRRIIDEQGFFDDPEKRLLVFTEFRDTLEYLVGRLRGWGLNVGSIHGGMHSGRRDEPGTRLYAEQQFRAGDIQVLVATEAAGEGINLQCCNILFNYDIPWNPNRLEQRMGRIHRYGQSKDCLIFNFVAANTIEGRVLRRLLERLEEIREALEDDAVFNVVGEVLPAAQIDRVFRAYYEGRLAEDEVGNRMLDGFDEQRFREICQAALEGLATRQLNLAMITERRAQADARRVVPETVARFMAKAAVPPGLRLDPVRTLPHTFDAGPTPPALMRLGAAPDWKLPDIAARYRRITTDKDAAAGNRAEWVTPGHPLFEALRRDALDRARGDFADGACFHSLRHDEPARIDFYRARVVDGRGVTVTERLFGVELNDSGDLLPTDPAALGDMTPAETPAPLPAAASLPEATGWLHERLLAPLLSEALREREAEIDRIARHVELALTEVVGRADADVGKAAESADKRETGSAGRLAQAQQRHAEAVARRERRRDDMERQRRLTLQDIERVASALVLPHPEASEPEVGNLRPNPETEAIAMRVAMDHERGAGREVEDVHERNLGYDIQSTDPQSGDLRLIEVKGLAAAEGGDILLTPNERRVAEDRRDCYWLYVVTGCAGEPRLTTVLDPAARPWREVSRVQHYRLAVDALADPVRVREDEAPYGTSG